MTQPNGQSATVSDARLDKGETIVDCETPGSAGTRWRFRKLASERARTLRLLPHTDATPKAIERFHSCGDSPRVQRSLTTGDLRIVSHTCGQRWCPACAITRQAKTTERLQALVALPSDAEWRFVTLTLKSCHAPLKKQLAHLRSSFRRLRQTHLWSRSQRYGKGFIELTFNSDTGQWHPHIHVLTCGNYMDKGFLSKAWGKSSAGSYIVDIALVRQGDSISSYVTKYVGKPPKLRADHGGDALWLEHWDATHKQQMVITFGKLPKVPKSTTEQDEAADPQWVEVGHLNMIIFNAKRGNPAARTLLLQLCDGDPQLLEFMIGGPGP